MEKLSSLIEDQYHKPELFELILERLKEKGVDLDQVSRKDIAVVDEFHVRGAEVSKELARELGITHSRVLDVGCGIGGPCRMFADDYNCMATGIDMSHEYIRTARKLSELVGLDHKTTFIQADALKLPFYNKSFDAVWTQHVQMNIDDKAKFYSEIYRVLTENGIFVYYDIFSKINVDVDYPVPWANDASVSFLNSNAEIESILNGLGLKKLQTVDQSQRAINFLNNLFEKIKRSGSPKLGLNELMGDSAKEKLNNILKGLEQGKIVLQSGMFKK